MILTLARDSQQPRPLECMLGVLNVNGRGKFQTVERPWLAEPNAPCGVPNYSCIPLGAYRMESRETEARGKHWILSNPALGIYRYETDIPAGAIARALILVHAANYAHELLGCIAPGKGRLAPRQGGNQLDEWMITDSRAALNEIRNLIGTSFDLQLVITGAAAQP